MPNWVFNYVEIKGSKEDREKVKKQLNTPFSKTYKDYESKDGKLVSIYKEATFTNPIFAFWNIVKPTDMDAYLNAESSGIPANPDNPDAWFASDNWYDWNVRNWGTKWDVAVSDGEEYAETEIQDETEDSIIYRFNTAWSPPVKAIEELSKQHPNLVFSLDFEEETSWGGEIEFRNGIHTELNTYEWRCECGEMYKEEPKTDDDGYCPKCNKEEVNA